MISIRRSSREDRRPRTPVRRRNRVCPAPRRSGIARRPLLGHRQRLAEPAPHHDQLHARRDQPRRRRQRATCSPRFNSKSTLAGKWENVILQAAQVWAQQTNINFAVVPDDGAPGGIGPRRAGRSRVRRYPDRRLQLRLLHSGPDLSAAAGQQLLDRRRHDLQHRPVVQHRLDLRPVHRGHARVRPRARAEREQRQQRGDVRHVHRQGRPPWPATTSRASGASTAATARARPTRTTPAVLPTVP